MGFGHHGFSEFSHLREVNEITRTTINEFVREEFERVQRERILETIRQMEQISINEINNMSLTEQKELIKYIADMGTNIEHLENLRQKKISFLQKHNIGIPSDISESAFTEIKRIVPEIEIKDGVMNLPKNANTIENFSKLFNYFKKKHRILDTDIHNIDAISAERYFKPLKQEIKFREIKETDIKQAQGAQDTLIEVMQNPSDGKSAEESAGVFIKHFNDVDQEARNRVANNEQIKQAQKAQDTLIEVMQNPSDGKSAEESAKAIIKNLEDVEQVTKEVPKTTVETFAENKSFLNRITEIAKNHKGILTLGIVLLGGAFFALMAKISNKVKINKEQAINTKSNLSIPALSVTLDDFKKRIK